MKVYLPPPSGNYGMVFDVLVSATGLLLSFLAFGVRHHPPEARKPTVYQIADRRLNG